MGVHALQVGGESPTEFLAAELANFAEYAPFVLLLMEIAKLSGTPAWRLHVIGGLLLAGRMLHVYCFACTKGHVPSRFGGVVLSFAALLGGAVLCLRVAF